MQGSTVLCLVVETFTLISKDNVVGYALSVTKGIDSCKNTPVNHYFVREAIPHVNIDYTSDNLVNMMIQTLLVSKSENHFCLVDTHC